MHRTLEEVMEDLRGCITTAANVAYTLHLRVDRPGREGTEELALLAVTIRRLNEIGAEAVFLAHEVQGRGDAGGRGTLPTEGPGRTRSA